MAWGKVRSQVAASQDRLECERGMRPGHSTFRRMLAIADALPVLIAYLDTNQRYLFVNHALAEWLGRPRKEILGRTMRELLGEETYRSREPMVGQRLPESGNGSLLASIILNEGSWRSNPNMCRKDRLAARSRVSSSSFRM